LAVWQETISASGTVTERYLRYRGIGLHVPESLRHHRALKHYPTGLTFDAMVAAVQDGNGEIVAVHRTYLLPDGTGKAQVSSPKMALGPLGDGAVRLAGDAPAIGLAEGIETGLSVMELFDIPVWAALGSRLDAVSFPREVRELQIFGDNGEAGHAAANKAAAKLHAEGRHVFLRFPPPEYGDWNDVLRGREAA
jgi:hypothetical protein